jgi:hypothetical protein
MSLEASVNGSVKCPCEGDAKECSKILKRYRISHRIDGKTVKIRGELTVTPFFEKKGFRTMLIQSLKRYGKCELYIKY